MTESEEMYLVSIARLKEQGKECPVPVSRLAEELSVLPVSVNQMVRKLEEEGWVCYVPYKGVDLTDRGEQLALQILRHRRLWEVFLVEHLKIAPVDANELACRMEHFFPSDAAERLAAFLGNPTLTPFGEVIPGPQSEKLFHYDLPIAVLGLEESGEVTRIEIDPAGRDFLMSEGLLPGQIVKVLAYSSSGARLLQTTTGRSIHLSATLLKAIWVKKLPESTLYH